MRAVLAATLSPTWGVYAGYELYENASVRPGAEEYLDSEKYQYRPRDWAAAEREGRTLAAFLTTLNAARATHPALQALRTLRFHATDDDPTSSPTASATATTPDDDTVVVIVNLNPHSARTTTVHLDLASLGLAPGDAFVAHDLVTGGTWRWGEHVFVDLAPWQTSRTSCTSGGCREPVQALGRRGRPPPAEPERSRAAAVDTTDLDRLVDGAHHDPHGILGPHPDGDDVTVRALRPGATSVAVVVTQDGTRTQMTHEHRGVWAGRAARRSGARLPARRRRTAASRSSDDDPYRFLPTLGEVDLHLIGEGRHEQLWDVLGAHVRTSEHMGDVAGTVVRRLGPARAGRAGRRRLQRLGRHGHPDALARLVTASGSCSSPTSATARTTSSSILTRDGSWVDKADPMAAPPRCPPATASVVYTSRYEWGDDDWMVARAARNPHTGPMSIYEVHLGSWRPGLTLPRARRPAHRLRHRARGSPTSSSCRSPSTRSAARGATRSRRYYAPTSRFGHPDDFRYLVDACTRPASA